MVQWMSRQPGRTNLSRPRRAAKRSGSRRLILLLATTVLTTSLGSFGAFVATIAIDTAHSLAAAATTPGTREADQATTRI
jgi:hypothetical protein